MNVRAATSPIVPIVTVVGVPMVVEPMLSGTAPNVNVSVPTNWFCGSTVIVYVPVACNVNVSRKAVAAKTDNAVTNPPLGSRTVRTTPAPASKMLLLVTNKVTFCPAVAVNVRTATSPIVAVVTVVGAPIVVEPKLSGTAFKVNVRVPVSWICGSTVIVYVPVVGSVNVSWKAAADKTDSAVTNPPFGSRTLRSAPAPPPRMVFPATDNVTFWPAVAANVRTATSPIVPIVTAVGVPIVVVLTLSGTAPRTNVSVPVNWFCGSTVMVYVPVAGRVNTS